MAQFQIRKDNYTQGRIVETWDLADVEIQADEIVVRIDKFAYTANNITYAVAGDMIGYWHFFPPYGADPREWGVIPVWGFAEVVRSGVEGLSIGERLYGYFPPATHLVMRPQHLGPQHFIDGSAHRAHLPAGYNYYSRLDFEAGYDPRQDDARMLLLPLHITSYCIWDALSDQHWYEAEQIIILSASSKTSIGLAIALHNDPSAPTMIGVTSGRHVDTLRSLGIYDSILTYDAIEQLPTDAASVIVDMSGNTKVLTALYMKLGDHLKYCINVGITHWNQTGKKNEIISQKSEFFFAPGHIQKRIGDWGYEVFDQRSKAFVRQSSATLARWLTFETVLGLEGLQEIHAKVCQGRIAANVGLIVKLQNQ